MTEEQQSSHPEWVYSLDIRVPESPAHRVPVIDTLTIGSQDDVEICLQDYQLAPKHCVFRVHNGVLSLHNLAKDDDTKLGEQALQQGKMYIIDKDDKITINDVDILIRKEAVKSEEEYQSILKQNQPLEELEEEEEEDLQFEEGTATRIRNLIQKSKEEQQKARKEKSSNEMEEDKKSSFASKIKNKKAAASQKAKEKKKQKRKIVGKGPGLIVRLLSLCLTLSLAYALYYGVFPLLDIKVEFDTQISELYRQLSSFIPSSLSFELGQKILIFLILFFLLEVIGHIVFAVPLPFLLLGISHQGSLLAQRTKGFLRLLFNLLTTPFLIFDLPILIGKRPLKEVLSGTFYAYRSETLKLFVLLFLFPLIIIASISSPLFLEPEASQSLILSEMRPKRLSKKDKEAPFIDANSQFFGWRVKAPKAKNSILLPTFSVIDQEVSKGLHYYHLLKDASAYLKETKHLSFSKVLNAAREGNPLFDLFYQFSGQGLNEQQKIKRLIKSSFSLQVSNYSQFIFENGPFVFGHLAIKRFITKEFNVPANAPINWLTTSAGDFLIIENIRRGKDIHDIIVSFKDDHIKTYETSYKAKGRSLAKNYLNKIFSYTLALRKRKNKEQQAWNAFQAIDLIRKLETKRNVQEEQFNHLYESLYSQLGEALGSSQQGFLQINVNYLKETLNVLTFLNEKSTQAPLVELILKLKKLQQAVDQKDSDFFTLKEDSAILENASPSTQPESI